MSNPITLFWSTINEGPPSSVTNINPDTPFDLGNLGSPGSLSAMELSFYFESTEGIEKLLNCGFYISPYDKVYPQPLTGEAVGDWRELRQWGDVATMGLQINLDKANEYPEASWQSFSKTAGGTQFNKISLVKEAVVLGEGFNDTDHELPISGAVYFQLRLLAPVGVDHVGLRYFNLVFDYTY
jgi:hypothetical protein